MSSKYDEYLQEHRANVYNAFKWIAENIPDIFGDDTIKSEAEYQCKYGHDMSKTLPEEYIAYDAYFYGNNRSHQVVQDFNMAWLHHIHTNPHHWQYWILNNDDPEKGEIKLQMPDIYIIEMICDWWSFSFGKGNLREIFSWYDQRKNYIKLNEDTRQKVEKILERIAKRLDELDVEKQNNIDNINKGLDAMKDIVEKQIPTNLMNGLLNTLQGDQENKE